MRAAGWYIYGLEEGSAAAKRRRQRDQVAEATPLRNDGRNDSQWLSWTGPLSERDARAAAALAA
jgi:hypothetical protein